MTAGQLVNRAGAIWGAKRITRTDPRSDGGLDVSCLRLGRGSTQPYDGTAHRLNADGDAVCHTDCTRVADAL